MDTYYILSSVLGSEDTEKQTRQGPCSNMAYILMVWVGQEWRDKTIISDIYVSYNSICEERERD